LILFLTACCVFLGYLVYGLTGFGASIVALPLIVQFVPLKLAVAMMLAMDLVAGILFGLKNRGDVNFSEARSLLIWMGVGMVLGVTLLIQAPESLLLCLEVLPYFKAPVTYCLDPKHITPSQVIGGYCMAPWAACYQHFLARAGLFTSFILRGAYPLKPPGGRQLPS